MISKNLFENYFMVAWKISIAHNVLNCDYIKAFDASSLVSDAAHYIEEQAPYNQQARASSKAQFCYFFLQWNHYTVNHPKSGYPDFQIVYYIHML